jgi:hypothetical protein
LNITLLAKVSRFPIIGTIFHQTWKNLSFHDAPCFACPYYTSKLKYSLYA